MRSSPDALSKLVKRFYEDGWQVVSLLFFEFHTDYMLNDT